MFKKLKLLLEGNTCLGTVGINIVVFFLIHYSGQTVHMRVLHISGEVLQDEILVQRLWVLKICPGWCGSVGCELACETKGCWFNSWSGHMPVLRARSLVVGTREETDQWFSPSFSPSSPLSKKIFKKCFKKSKSRYLSLFRECSILV